MNLWMRFCCWQAERLYAAYWRWHRRLTQARQQFVTSTERR